MQGTDTKYRQNIFILGWEATAQDVACLILSGQVRSSNQTLADVLDGAHAESAQTRMSSCTRSTATHITWLSEMCVSSIFFLTLRVLGMVFGRGGYFTASKQQCLGFVA